MEYSQSLTGGFNQARDDLKTISEIIHKLKEDNNINTTYRTSADRITNLLLNITLFINRAKKSDEYISNLQLAASGRLNESTGNILSLKEKISRLEAELEAHKQIIKDYENKEKAHEPDMTITVTEVTELKKTLEECKQTSLKSLERKDKKIANLRIKEEESEKSFDEKINELNAKFK